MCDRYYLSLVCVCVCVCVCVMSTTIPRFGISLEKGYGGLGKRPPTVSGCVSSMVDSLCVVYSDS